MGGKKKKRYGWIENRGKTETSTHFTHAFIAFYPNSYLNIERENIKQSDKQTQDLTFWITSPKNVKNMAFIIVIFRIEWCLLWELSVSASKNNLLPHSLTLARFKEKKSTNYLDAYDTLFSIILTIVCYLFS